MILICRLSLVLKLSQHATKRISQNFDGRRRPMDFELASSSVEEGEIVDQGFPYYKSYKQYYYYPRTTLFIGRNTVPRSMNYKSDLYCSRLKKEIKQDYPYIPFNLLDNSKTFFGNRFAYLRELRTAPDGAGEGGIPSIGDDALPTRPESYALKEIKTDHREISSFTKKSTSEGRYDKLYQQLFFTHDGRAPLLKSIYESGAKTVLVMEDRALRALDEEHAYIFCRVTDEIVARSDAARQEGGALIKKVILEDIFYSKVLFYKYLELYAEHAVKSFNSEEVRVYEKDGVLLVVHSSTVFLSDGAVRRLYDGLDVRKNVMLVCNRDGPAAVDAESAHWDGARVLRGLDLELPEGDYVINNGKVYRIDNHGEPVDYADIDFSDFV
ncbi:hypothetical protein PAPHI01_2214 [Pancytospora philotis]|nr:hypothetical protein PAPHI01_2214 [Pancytospora philotis]